MNRKDVNSNAKGRSDFNAYGRQPSYPSTNYTHVKPTEISMLYRNYFKHYYYLNFINTMTSKPLVFQVIYVKY